VFCQKKRHLKEWAFVAETERQARLYAKGSVFIIKAQGMESKKYNPKFRTPKCKLAGGNSLAVLTQPWNFYMSKVFWLNSFKKSPKGDFFD